MLSIAAVACLLFNSPQSKAQIYNQFVDIQRDNYDGEFNLDPTKKMAISPDKFVIPPNNVQDIDLNDGYAVVDLGFTYRYNDEDYSKVWVSINGFVTFTHTTPPSDVVVARDPEGLFIVDAGSTPVNVIAPFWGDHKYWKPVDLSKGFAPTTISYLNGEYETTDPTTGNTVTRKMIIIEWLNLNINWLDGVTGDTNNGNVASFQLVIYEGPNDVDAKQGNVEFRYGQRGPTKEQQATGLYMRQSGISGSIGIKGTGLGLGSKADFVNAVYNGGEEPKDPVLQKTSKRLSTEWPTSKDPKLSLLFVSVASVTDAESWGDGDADMSKAAGGADVGTSQDMYVNIFDVRTIMKSVATGTPLDSIYAKAAYHADVNHDGRFYHLVKNNVITEQIIAGVDDDGNNIYKQDTFLIKAAVQSGGFGFKPYYGQNSDTLFIEMFDGTKATVTVLLPDNSEDDYVLQVAKIRQGDIGYFEALNPGEFTISLKKYIHWKNPLITDSLPPMITDYKKQLFWAANEEDASVILSYLGAKTPMLPWIYDDVIYNGKIGIAGSAIANNLKFDNVIQKDENVYEIPVYLNGYNDKSFSSKFNFNGEILQAEAAPNVLIEYYNATKTAVIVAEGNFDVNTPVAYLTVKTDDPVFIANAVRFTGEKAENVVANLKTNAVVAADGLDILAQNIPNPVTNSTTFALNIPEAGNYQLVITDILGNIVKTVANDYMNAGTKYYHWNCTNNAGNIVSNGTYIYRLVGADNVITKRLVVNY